MASELELNLARLTDSAKRPRAPRDLPARLRLLAALLREVPADGAGPRLIWRDPDGCVRMVAIDRRLVIGREATCDVVFVGARISRRHCALWLEKGGVQIQDLQSANGTFVNGVRVARQSLRDGDTIELGGLALAVVLGREAEGRVDVTRPSEVK